MTGHLFAWDREFSYAGRTPTPPGVSFSVSDDSEHRLYASLAGAFFLSGSRNPSWLFYASDTEEYVAIAVIDDSGILVVIQKEAKVSLLDRVILCGPKVKDPAFVGSFCSRFPTNPMYVCPMTDELPAFGVLARELLADGDEWPRRVFTFRPKTDEMMALSSAAYDDNLNGDAYGRMAYIMGQGSLVKNEIMDGPGVSFFYGQMLARLPVFHDSVYIINPESLPVYLPKAPVSLKLYAATSVPVLAAVSDDFRKITGHTEEKAVVATASDFIPGLGTFIHFHGAMTKSGIFCSGTVGSANIKGKLPVFRYNKVYVVDAKKYVE
jgi:hypothetical protein